MNTFVQLGLGLCPALVIVWLLILKRKAFNLRNIACVAMVTVACLGCGGYGAYLHFTDAVKEQAMSKSDMMLFANSLAAENACTSAWDVVDQYSDTYSYDDECTLLSARLYALQGDYQRACGIYKKLSATGDFAQRVKDEYDLVSNALTQNSSDDVMVSYLEQCGKNPADYGYEQTSAESKTTVTDEDIADTVAKAILADYEDIKDSDIEKCAGYIADANEIYSSYTAGKGLGDADIKSLSKKFDKMYEKYSTAFSQRCMRLARLKMNVLAENFDKITSELSENSSYDELMIASELYLNGKAKTSDFPEAYQQTDKESAELVISHLEEVYKNNSDDMNVQEKKALKARIEAVEAEINEPVLSQMKKQLIDKSEVEAGTDKSKVYLQLAKIEDSFDNETSSDSYLNQAIYDSQDCEDDDYTGAMSQIIGVINNDDNENTENIKNVTDYVDAVIDNSMTVDAYAIISDGAVTQDNADDYTNDDDNTADNDVADDTQTQGKDTTKDFSQTMTDYVSKIKSAVVIGKIDTTKFETITSRVQIASEYAGNIDELKSKMSVYDCSVKIDNYDLKKIDFSGSNILLLCDVSGSMDSSIGDLRDAVSTFVADKNADENLAVVTFDDSIVATKDFGTSDSELATFAQELSGGGGTDMFSALVNCLNTYKQGDNTNDVIILMTDGQDNDPRDEQTIYDEIGKLATEKGITVYTLGLGSEVDTAYLTTIADSGSGDFVYVSDSASLESFYDMLHGQVANQYEITYKAQDTMTMTSRTLEVVLDEENVRDSKTYSIGTETSNTDDTTSPVSATESLTVSGLDVKYIYKGTTDVVAHLKGTGFNKDYSADLKLNGNIDYNIDLEYVDDTTYSLKIPAAVAVGVYNVEVSINGKKAILPNGFAVIVQGIEKETSFGPYSFTSLTKTDDGNGTITLSGVVKMNGWLNFKGDVTISGNPDNDASITVTDNSGSYVKFDSATAEGLGKTLADKGVSIDLPALRSFTLYNDKSHLYDYENYQVDDIDVTIVKIFRFLNLGNPSVRLYPDNIQLNIGNVSPELPFQNAFLKNKGKDEKVSTDWSGTAELTDRNLGVIIDIDNKDSTGNMKNVTFCGASMMLDLSSLSMHIDSIKEEYSIGFMVNLGFIDTKVGADIGWKEGLNLDSLMFHLDHDFTTNISGVPVTFSDFGLGAENIKEAVETNNWWKLKLNGEMSIAACKLKEFAPGIAKYLGKDVSVFEMPDTSVALGFSPFGITAKAELTFLSDIKLASAEVSLGIFDYTNTMLGLDNEQVGGLMVALNDVGITWDTDCAGVSATVNGELSVNNRFVGIKGGAKGSIYFDCWLFDFEYDVEGQMILGYYNNHSNQGMFIAGYRYYESDGSTGGKIYYITTDGDLGPTEGSLG